MQRILIAATLALASLASLPAHASPNVDVQIVIGNPPPPPRHEIVPPPRAGYVWVPGYWAWSGHRHVWVAGHWEVARPGQYYRAPHWRKVHNGWQLDRGGWLRNDRHAPPPNVHGPAPRKAPARGPAKPQPPRHGPDKPHHDRHGPQR